MCVLTLHFGTCVLVTNPFSHRDREANASQILNGKTQHCSQNGKALLVHATIQDQIHTLEKVRRELKPTQGGGESKEGVLNTCIISFSVAKNDRTGTSTVLRVAGLACAARAKVENELTKLKSD